MKVLTVEDDAATQVLLRRILARRGHEVVACYSAEDAMQSYQGEFFPLMILDVVLPDMDGLAFCRWVRQQPGGDQHYIVIGTGRDQPNDLQDALAAGGNDFVPKPYEVPRLDVRLSIAEQQVVVLTERKQAMDLLKRAFEEMEHRVEARTAELARTNETLLSEVMERRRAEDERAREHNLLRTLINSLPDSIYFKDTRDRHIIDNQSYLQLIGINKAEDIAGKTSFEFLPTEVALQFEAEDRAICSSGKPILNQEECMTDRAGQLRWFSTSRIPIFNAQKEVIGLLCLRRGITEQKKHEVEREKLIKDLQSALAKVKTLSGMLPICSWCKKIRDDSGYWNQLEVFVRDRSDVDFSHGICPDCAKKLAVDVQKAAQKK